MSKSLASIYPVCIQLLNSACPKKIPAETERDIGPNKFLQIISNYTSFHDLPPFFSDLAHIEWAVYHASSLAPEDIRPISNTVCLNPAISLLEVSWSGLPDFYKKKEQASILPAEGKEYVLVWPMPGSGEVVVRTADQKMLLAVKIIVEELDVRQVSRDENVSIATLGDALERAVDMGILLKPHSRLVRDKIVFAADSDVLDRFLTANVFTLQWHITQACDLHCRHCYDRSARSLPSLEVGLHILDDLYDFCHSRHVFGQVSFTGGNPLLHPHFLELYRAAAERGFMTAVLGNPTHRDMLKQICSVQQPEFFQVSLEGLQGHNDYIRGPGHFDRVMSFLEDLKGEGVYSMVMLTLTRANLDQVLPLAEVLRDRTDLFTFNRLSMVGEGAKLQTPGRDEYRSFLKEYLAAAATNPIMGLKDNLINIILDEQKKELFSGCAGFGCGAAFNFFALLPDGEVHACRKFSSPIGDILTQKMAAIYDSETAIRYRQGATSCKGCRIRHACGGCLAVTSSQGLDVFSERDPCCFLDKE